MGVNACKQERGEAIKLDNANARVPYNNLYEDPNYYVIFLFLIVTFLDKSFVSLVRKCFLHCHFKTPRQWYTWEFFQPSHTVKVSQLLFKVFIVHELSQINIFQIWVLVLMRLGCRCQHLDCIFVETRADVTIAVSTWFVMIPCSQICRVNTQPFCQHKANLRFCWLEVLASPSAIFNCNPRISTFNHIVPSICFGHFFSHCCFIIQ